MRYMKSMRVLVLILICALALIFTGCGNNEGTSSPEGDVEAEGTGSDEDMQGVQDNGSGGEKSHEEAQGGEADDSKDAVKGQQDTADLHGTAKEPQSGTNSSGGGGGQDRVPSASGGQGSGDAKPALRITGHVSYPSPTECKFTQSYCSAHDASVYVLEDGSSILAENGKVIGINVISSEINSVRYEGKEAFVWSDQTRDFIDRLLEQGIIYSSYGNNCIVPGNTDIVSTMVREYDAIEPVSFDLYIEYYT